MVTEEMSRTITTGLRSIHSNTDRKESFGEKRFGMVFCSP
jgi:hypothetical protein